MTALRFSLNLPIFHVDLK